MYDTTILYLILENTKSDEIVSFRTLFEMFSTQIDDVMMSRCQNNERREEDFRIIFLKLADHASCYY
jgi:hypothetical protein